MRYIGFRYAVLVSGLLVATMFLLGYLDQCRENKALVVEMENKTKILKKTVSKQYIDAIVSGDEATIRKSVGQLWNSDGFESLGLYSPDGYCIWHLYSYLKESRLPEDAVRELKGGANLVLNRTLFQNAPVYEAIIPLTGGGHLYGFLKIDYPLREFYQKIEGTYYLLGMVTAGFVIASMLWAWLIGNTILRPVDWLSRGVKKVSEGDFSTYVPSSSTKELSVLTENFNEMVTRLKNTRDALNRHQASLEENIARIKAELEETHQKLLHSEKLASIGRLAAGVAHEINNPLTGIGMLSQLLLDTAEQREDRENLKKVLEESLRCQKIVSGLLSFARDRKVEYKVVDINSVLGSCLGFLSKQKIFNDIEVIKRLSTGPISVEGDSEQIEEAFTNIMLNAAECMDGRGKLFVESSLSDNVIKVSISDTGCGIPQGSLGRIFDPFYTSWKRGQGTGLGLSITYGIVREHRGTIEVESQVGKGSTFTVCLPRKGGKKSNVQKLI